MAQINLNPKDVGVLVSALTSFGQGTQHSDSLRERAQRIVRVIGYWDIEEVVNERQEQGFGDERIPEGARPPAWGYRHFDARSGRTGPQ